MTDQDAVYRGKALHVAEFLSTFQAFFRRNDAERKGPISVEMIEQALGYRKNLLRHYDLENKLVMLRKDGTLTDEDLKELEDTVAASKASIASSSAIEKAVHELLRRFEVWCTKALANHVLMHCVKATNHRDKSICCSPALNLPGVSHFLPLLQAGDVAEENEHACELGVPANAWTWKEYLRISNMITLLQNPEDAMKSTLTAASPSLIGTRKEELKLSEKDVLTLADLAALWVRSQRNTSALLHLMHLFKVTEGPKEPTKEHYSIRASAQYRGKQIVRVHDDHEDEESEDDTDPRYVAEYVGNHKGTRKHVLKCSGPLDKLVEWAVTNQALFTYPYIRESIPERLGHKMSPKKRPAPVNNDTGEEVAAKRRRTIPCENEDRLMHACNCYVLRWFARRNRKVTSVLFTSKLKHIPLFPYEDLVDYLVEQQNIPEKVKKDLKKRCGSKDRTLARIDRRTQIGKYNDENIATSFRGIVVLLLESLANCSPPERLTESEVLASQNDFECLYNTFLHGKSATEAAELLLDPGADFDVDPVDILLSFTEPWEDHCFACKGVLGEEDTVTIQCDNCSKLFHEKCEANCDKRPLGELVKSYGPLAQLDATLSEDMEDEYGEVWRCSTCQVMTKPQTSENSVFMEAKLCKALIRDIGMESYSLPFHDESPLEASDDQESSKHVSLRRLDAMMDYTRVKNDPSLSEMERQNQLNAIGNPFHIPPWSRSSSAPPQQIKWVTEGMLQHPMQLLCKGVEVMTLQPNGASDQWMADRTAFSRRFTIIFSTWFLCPRAEPFSLQPSGRLSHMLGARPPWTQSSCIICRVRPVSASEATSLVCDSSCCQQRHSSENFNGCQTGGISCSSEVQAAASLTPSTCPSTGVDSALDSYNELSSLVGSLVMVLPGDPLLQFVSKELGKSIDHMDRPMFFVVASYLPRLFSMSEKRVSGSIDDEGIFHVLPILWPDQLKNLLKERVMRRPPESYIESDAWTQLKLLDLEAVIQMSATELRRKLKETCAIREAIDSTIRDALSSTTAGGLAADCSVKQSLECISKEKRAPSCCFTVSEYSHDMVRNYTSLIDCLLRSETPLVRNLVGLLRPAAVSDDDATDDESISCDFQTNAESMSTSEQHGDDVEHGDDTEMEGLQDASSRDGRNLEHESSGAPEVTPAEIPAALDRGSELPLAPTANQYREAQAQIARMRDNLPAGRQMVGPQEQQLAMNHHALSLQGQPLNSQAMVNRDIHVPQSHTAELHVARPGAQQPAYHVDPNAQSILGGVYSHDPASVAGQPPVGRFISKEDLNICAQLPGTILTQVEAAFLVEAISRSLPNLGLRLLCPRYNLEVARAQLRYILRGDYSRLPRVQERLWQFVVTLDYGRSKRETGDFILRDSAALNNFEYRRPVKPLPLDRAAEHYLVAEPSFSAGQPQLGPSGEAYPHHGSAGGCIDLIGSDESTPTRPFTANPSTKGAFRPPEDRIRGGGLSDEGLVAMHHDPGEEDDESQVDVDAGEVAVQSDAEEEVHSVHLSNVPTVLGDIPRDLWQHKLVYIRVMTTVHGEGAEEATSIGAVQMDQHNNESNRACVALFHFSNAGYLPEPSLQLLSPSQCFVLQEGSREASIAEQWEGFARLINPYLPRYVSDDQINVDSPVGGPEMPPKSPREEVNNENRSASIQNEGVGSSVSNSSTNHDEFGEATEATQRETVCVTAGVANCWPSSSQGTAASAKTTHPGRHDEQENEAEAQHDEGNVRSSHETADDSPPSHSAENESEDEVQHDVVHHMTPRANENDSPPSHNGDMESEGGLQHDGVNAVTVLAELAKDSWENKLVSSIVQIANMAESEATVEATILGVVQPFSNAEEDDEKMEDDQVMVALFYISTIGYLSGSVLQELPVEHLYVIHPGSDEERVAKEWDGFKQWKASFVRSNNQADSSSPVGHNGGKSAFEPEDLAGSGVTQTRIVDHLSNDSVSIEDTGMELVRQLCQRQQGPAPLGKLPDSRAILWVQSDPRALYVRIHCNGKSKRKITDYHGSDGRLSCPWCCGDGRTDARLCFATQTALDDHLRVRHNFGQLYVDFEDDGHLYRISEGREILSLSTQLTSAICAACPGLSVFLDRPSSTFPFSAVLDLSSEGKGEPKRIINGTVLSNEDARSLLCLWSKITRLFAVESTGLFRFENDACETLLYFGSQESPTRVLDIIDDGSTDCLNEARNTAASDESRSCSLCGSRGDCNIEANGEVRRGNGYEGLSPSDYSCGLLCLSRSSPLMTESIPALGNCGSGGVARSMLIRISRSVPESLRRRATGETASSFGNDACMWEEGNYQNWRYLVERAGDIGAFLQAFVVLVHSINVSKLPRWWAGAREGWSSAFVTMGSAPYGFPSLFLRLYALDAVIFDYMTGLSSTGAAASYLAEDSAPAVLRGLNNEERMEKVLEWANRMNYDCFSGANDNECLVCKDGGDLICCEFCKTSQHAKCCRPPIVDPFKLKIWACPMCVNDMAVLVGEDDIS